MFHRLFADIYKELFRFRQIQRHAYLYKEDADLILY